MTVCAYCQPHCKQLVIADSSHWPSHIWKKKKYEKCYEGLKSAWICNIRMSMCVCVWNVFECEKTYTKAWAAITWNTYWIYWVALTHFTTLLRTVTVNPYREKLEAPARGQPRSTCGYGMLPSSAQDLPNGRWANQALASEHCLPHLPASLKSGGFQPQQINAATQWNKNTPGQGICMHGWGSSANAQNWESRKMSTLLGICELEMMKVSGDVGSLKKENPR